MPLEDSPVLQGMRRRTLEALRYADGGEAPPPAGAPPPLPPELDTSQKPWDPNLTFYQNWKQGNRIPDFNITKPSTWDPTILKLGPEGIREAAHGAERLATPIQNIQQPWTTNPSDYKDTTPGRELAGGAHQIFSGLGQAAAPFVLPAALVANPVGTIGALAYGTAGGYAAQKGAEALGAAPEYAHLAGDVGNVLGGEAGPMISRGLGAAAEQVGRWLPTQAELQAAGTAASERLRASGIYGTTAGMGQFLDPTTMRDMAITTGASLGSGAYSAAEIAAARARQTARQIQDLVRRPSEAAPEVGEAQPVRDVLARSVEDLERRIPNNQRVVSPDPTKLINGQPFSSLDMNAPSEGYLPFVHLGPEEANRLNDGMWQDAIQESELPGGSAAMEAVRKTGASPPTAEFLHRSMQNPQRARYWYELSGDAFTGGNIDIPREMQPGFIDNVAATSGGAKPYTNMKRALGTYAENLQNVPIYTDLRDPASVRNALNPELERLGTHKYQNFSGTMQYTTGLDNRPPISVNDVQQADIFGIKGTDLAKNPVLYEVLSRYTNKIRDAQNAFLPQGAQPWETWQVQAPTWVQNRVDKDPTSTYDDYAMVLPRIIQELNDAGVQTPNGKINLETLTDPRTPNVMSGTRETFMGTPIGTVEFATNKTPQGAAAAQVRAQLEQYDPATPWVRDAKKAYEQIQRNSMADFAERHTVNKKTIPSYSSQLMSEITGQKLDVSRQEPTGYGTYEGDINPNLRIPMGGWNSKGEFVALDKAQREAFLSYVGQDLDQDGMAASHFATLPDEQAQKAQTYSVFMQRYDNQVDQKMVQDFSRRVGYPVNVSRTPNGILVDVNIADKGVGPTLDAVRNASDATFRSDPNVHGVTVVPRSYDSDFVHNSEYQEKIDAQQQRPTDPQQSKIDNPGRGRRAGNPPADLSNLQRIRQEIRAIAQRRDAEFAKWTQNAQARAAKLKPSP